MWKKAFALALVLVMALSIAAQATGARVPQRRVTLSFSGTTAHCVGYVRADNTTDEISATMKLWNRGKPIRTWTADKKLIVNIDENVPVTSGETYILTLDYTINDGPLSTMTSSPKTCP